MSNLKGKTAVITGSTKGIGLEIAQSLAAEGVNVVINGLGNASDIERERLALEKKFGIEATYSQADVANPDEIRNMVANAGDIDILVNNAGIQFVESIEDFPAERWDQIFATNLSSVFHASKAAIPGMKKREFGRIINIASAHGLVASEKKSAYVAAKHGVVGLTKVIALETAEFGITCNAICPGWVHTSLVERQLLDKAKASRTTYEEEKLKLIAGKHPNKRFVEPAEIGALVVYLSGEMARSITGAAICIDGGWTAQ